MLSKEEFRDRLVLRLLTYGIASNTDVEKVVSRIDEFIDKVDDDNLTMDGIDKLYREIVNDFNLN